VNRLDVLLQIASAMKNLHDSEVVHNAGISIKLGNILLSEFEVSGNVLHFLAKVADFGSAKRIGPSFQPNGEPSSMHHLKYCYGVSAITY